MSSDIRQRGSVASAYIRLHRGCEMCSNLRIGRRVMAAVVCFRSVVLLMGLTSCDFLRGTPEEAPLLGHNAPPLYDPSEAYDHTPTPESSTTSGEGDLVEEEGTGCENTSLMEALAHALVHYPQRDSEVLGATEIAKLLDAGYPATMLFFSYGKSSVFAEEKDQHLDRLQMTLGHNILAPKETLGILIGTASQVERATPKALTQLASARLSAIRPLLKDEIRVRSGLKLSEALLVWDNIEPVSDRLRLLLPDSVERALKPQPSNAILQQVVLVLGVPCKAAICRAIAPSRRSFCEDDRKR